MKNLIQGHFLRSHLPLLIRNLAHVAKTILLTTQKTLHNRFVYLPNNITHIFIRNIYRSIVHLNIYPNTQKKVTPTAS